MDKYNNSYNYTSEEIHRYLSLLQHQSTLAFIPAIVYLCLLSAVGSVGNCLVLLVYSTKITRTPLRMFIISMAIFDFLTNTLVIPGEIYDMFHVWDFNMPVLCKVRLYLNATLVTSSAFLLVAIATTRYKMVCCPFGKQITLTQAKVISLVLFITALATSIPYGLIQGSQTIKTPNENIFGRFCQVDNLYVNTIWPSVNSAFFILMFVISSIMIVVFYVCIGRKAITASSVLTRKQPTAAYFKLSQTTRADDSSLVTITSDMEDATVSFDTDPSLETSTPGSYIDQGREHNTVESTDQDNKGQMSSLNLVTFYKLTSSCEANLITNQHISSQSNNRDTICNEEIVESAPEQCRKYIGIDYRSKKSAECSLPVNKLSLEDRDNAHIRSKVKTSCLMGRTSCMMLTVTLFFFIGFLPFLALNFFLAAAPDKVASLEGFSLSLYQLFLRSYLINCAVNPIIYSLMDRRFRIEVVKLFTVKCLNN